MNTYDNRPDESQDASTVNELSDDQLEDVAGGWSDAPGDGSWSGEPDGSDWLDSTDGPW